MSGVETRNISRDSLFLLAEIRLENSQSEFRIKVRNLSPGGMLAEGYVPVVPGNRLKKTASGLRLIAKSTRSSPMRLPRTNNRQARMAHSRALMRRVLPKILAKRTNCAPSNVFG
jgi:hypothetical protein